MRPTGRCMTAILMINIGARFDRPHHGRDRTPSRLVREGPYRHLTLVDSTRRAQPKYPIIGEHPHVGWKTCCASEARARKVNQRGPPRNGGPRLTNGAKVRLPRLQKLRDRHQAAIRLATSRSADQAPRTDAYIFCTEVGQHQMWGRGNTSILTIRTLDGPLRAWAQWGVRPAASVGVQVAHPRISLVINVAGEAKRLMNMQEMGTAMKYAPNSKAIHS